MMSTEATHLMAMAKLRGLPLPSTMHDTCTAIVDFWPWLQLWAKEGLARHQHKPVLRSGSDSVTAHEHAPSEKRRDQGMGSAWLLLLSTMQKAADVLIIQPMQTLQYHAQRVSVGGSEPGFRPFTISCTQTPAAGHARLSQLFTMHSIYSIMSLSKQSCRWHSLQSMCFKSGQQLLV